MFCFHIEKIIVAVKIKEVETPILSSTHDLQWNTFLSNTHTIIVRGKSASNNLINVQYFYQMNTFHLFFWVENITLFAMPFMILSQVEWFLKYE